MFGLSIFKIPYVSKICRTPRDERTKFQSILCATINGWLHLKGHMPWNAQKYDVTIFQGQPYHETLVDYRTWVLYDRDGYLYGWHGQNREGYPFFESFEEARPGEPRPRMRLFSRLRSPKLPEGNQAEIISDGTIVGHTTYKVN